MWGRFTLGGKATAGRLRPPPQKGNRTQGQAHNPSSQYMKALQRGRATLRHSTSEQFPEHGRSGHKGFKKGGRQQLDAERLMATTPSTRRLMTPGGAAEPKLQTSPRGATTEALVNLATTPTGGER